MSPDIPVDEVTAGWWDATRDRRLVLQKCRDCGHWQHYPRALCTSCAGTDLGFEPAAGTGIVDTYTEVHRAARPDLPPPYLVARVRLDEGPVILTHLVGVDAVQQLIDRTVDVDWSPLTDGRHLPVFRPRNSR